MFSFSTPYKHQNISDFPIFSKDIEMEHWPEMVHTDMGDWNDFSRPWNWYSRVDSQLIFF